MTCPTEERTGETEQKVKEGKKERIIRALPATTAFQTQIKRIALFFSREDHEH